MSRDWNIVDDRDEVAPEPPAASGLDARRVHAVVLERRAANRARLRGRVFIPVALAMAAAAAVRAAASWREAPTFSVACGVVSIAGVAIAMRTLRSRGDANDEASIVAVAEVHDFATLGGSEDDAAAQLRRLGEDGRA